jgi:hypothetical protein
MFDKDPVESLADHEIRIEALEPRGPRMPHGPAPAICDLGVDSDAVSGATPRAHEIAELDDSEDSRVSFPSDLSEDEDARSTVAALPGETNSPFIFPRRPLVASNFYAEGNGIRAHVHSNSSHASDEAFALHNLRSVSQESLGSCRKMNIFDWSEQSRNDRDASGMDERPRTVHGKNGPEFRGSRAPGRRAPSSLHLRSQSVPVAREPTIVVEELKRLRHRASFLNIVQGPSSELWQEVSVLMTLKASRPT